jgi:CDP-glycerol glycerophosphotransferase (TagB/SpsB family)
LQKKNINNTSIYYNITNLEYFFSFKYNIIKIKYDIIFYDENITLIKPSDLSLYYELHALCHIKQIITGEMIDSIAGIRDNKNFYCIEYIRIDESFKLGIKIYEIQNNDIEYKIIYLLINRYLKYNNLDRRNDDLFNILLINKKHKQFLNIIKKNNGANYKLKKSFLLPPYSFLKNEISIYDNHWFFSNIFNDYFCFCKGIYCIKKNKYQNCKYKFYLTIIDLNRNLYNKTDILLSDFFIPNVEPVDGYPLFKEILNNNLSAYYMTIDEKIYNHFLINDKYSNYNLSKFPIIYEKIINGDFLEKYLELFLRLKIVSVIENYISLDNLFYNIEYINYIVLGHGIQYFKEFLYNDYRSFTKYDKIILPPSDTFIKIAKKYGWKERNIIKMCLPRYDKYNNDFLLPSDIQKKNSIFLMFTWRVIKEKKNISHLYFNNIFKILTNKELNKALIDNNISLYFTYHHSLKNKFKMNLKYYPNIIHVNQNRISELLKNSKLLITDFSSIVFDFIYQNKPFILYIPDLEEPFLQDIYIKQYYDIINGLKNGSIYFENKYFKIKEAIKAIIIYINNNFTLEKNLIRFYNYLNLNCRNNTINLINYLKRSFL